MHKNTKDITGQIFGEWEVLCRDTSSIDANVRWMCRCKCSTIKSVNGNHLRRGTTTMCRKCSEHKDKNRLPSRVLARIKRRALQKGMEINLDGDTLYELFIKQNRQCALTGLPIIFATTIRGDQLGQTTASLDRIDSSRGYTLENVQWVHKDLNIMKWDFPMSKFLELCRMVVEKYS